MAAAAGVNFASIWVGTGSPTARSWSEVVSKSTVRTMCTPSFRTAPSIVPHTATVWFCPTSSRSLSKAGNENVRHRRQEYHDRRLEHCSRPAFESSIVILISSHVSTHTPIALIDDSVYRLMDFLPGKKLETREIRADGYTQSITLNLRHVTFHCQIDKSIGVSI
jgi:hypothetical protein